MKQSPAENTRTVTRQYEAIVHDCYHLRKHEKIAEALPDTNM